MPVFATPYFTASPCVLTVLEASTGHVLKSDMEALEDGDPLCMPRLDMATGLPHTFVPSPVIAYRYEFGAFVFLSEDYLEELDATGYSKAFKDLYRWALSHGCKYLQLDSDATIYPELPWHKW